MQVIVVGTAAAVGEVSGLGGSVVPEGGRAKGKPHRSLQQLVACRDARSWGCVGECCDMLEYHRCMKQLAEAEQSGSPSMLPVLVTTIPVFFMHGFGAKTRPELWKRPMSGFSDDYI